MQRQTAGRLHDAPWDRSRGSSLPEILIVIAILALLIGLLVPSLSAARERARRMICAGNLRQWGFALQCYRDEENDFIPTEGTYLNDGVRKRGTWFNELPPYLDLPMYREIKGANYQIEEMPNMHVWICPSKNLSKVYKSLSGKNQFHYGMNQILDGMGDPPRGSDDTPGWPDRGSKPIRAVMYAGKPNTVVMFDIAPNSMAGSPRDVANVHYRDWKGRPADKFHGNYTNFLYLHGGVANLKAEDIVPDRDLRYGDIKWHHPHLYWGYPR
jgi:type II secretory pathway pseudopilin PulG